LANKEYIYLSVSMNSVATPVCRWNADAWSQQPR